MIIPILNPSRPPKEWWQKMVAEVKKRSKVKDASAIVGHIWYHKLTPQKRAEILIRYEKPGRKNPSEYYRHIPEQFPDTSQKESATMKSKSRRSFRSYLKNPAKKAKKAAKRVYSRSTRPSQVPPGFIEIGGPAYTYVVRGKRKLKVRKTSKGKKTMHRPRVYKVGNKFYRGKRTRLFRRGPTLLNPRRSRRLSRRNPLDVKSLLNKQYLMMVGTAGAGITIGALAMPVLVKYLPTAIKPPRKYMGVYHLAIGVLANVFVKNAMARQLGGFIAATGVYDLIASNVPQLGLVQLPSTASWLEKAALPAPGVSGSYPVSMLPVSPVARAALNGGYQSSVSSGYAGSYQAPDMRTQGFDGDSPYSDIEGFDD